MNSNSKSTPTDNMLVSHGSYNISTAVKGAGETTKLYKLIDDNALLEAIYDEESDGDSDDDETQDDVNVDKVMSKMKKDTPYFKVPFLKEQITKLRRLKHKLNMVVAGGAQQIYFEQFFKDLHSFMEKDPELMSNETSHMEDFVDDLSEIKNEIEAWKKRQTISIDNDENVKKLEKTRENAAKELKKFLNEIGSTTNEPTTTGPATTGPATTVAAGITSDDQEEREQLKDDFNELSKLFKKIDSIGTSKPSQNQLGGAGSKITLNDFKEHLLKILKKNMINGHY